MAKISEETRLHFSEAIQPYKDKITKTLEKEKTMLNGMHKGDIDFENKKILLCEDMIYVASLYMAQTRGDGVKAQPDALVIFPILIRSNTESCKISENIFRFSNFDFASPASTALAMLPTPDCIGNICSGILPWRCSFSRKSTRFSAIFILFSSGGVRFRTWSRISDSTIASIRSIPQVRYGEPTRSPAW